MKENLSQGQAFIEKYPSIFMICGPVSAAFQIASRSSRGSLRKRWKVLFEVGASGYAGGDAAAGVCEEVIVPE